MELSNADIREVEMSVPPGHHHLRTRIRLESGEEIVLQEATVANLVRAYVTIKTHPQKEALRLRGTQLEEMKRGFADWQLLEE